jgi:hypothetical protein
MNATIGMKVTGSYYGKAFTGEIVYERQHTINWNHQLINIQLDAPIDVLQLVRDTVMLEIDSNGREISRTGTNWIEEVK